MLTTREHSLATIPARREWIRTVIGSLLSVVAGAALLLSHPGYAQGTQSEEKAQTSTREKSGEKRRVARVLSNPGYRTISKAREYLDMEEYEEAVALLANMVNESRYSDYDKAKAWQMRAFVEINQDQYQAAITSNTQALDLQVLDLASELELMYSLANLYAFTEQYPQSIRFLELWFERTESPDAQAYFTAAQVYALSEQLDKALDHAETGMALHVKEADSEPRESWYRLLLAVRLQLEEYAAGSELLETMLELWPDKAEYYSQLNALYQELGREFDALLVMSIAKQNGLLNKQSEFERLAQMYRYHDYPYQGAVILDALMNNASGIPADAYEPAEDGHDWKKLGDSYAQAREWDIAQTAYLQAARLAAKGDNWLKLCQTAYRDGLWSEAKQYCGNAIDKGGLAEDEGYAWQIMAMAHYHNDNRQEAMEAFRACGDWSPVEEACTQWLGHITEQIEQEQRERERRLEEQKRSAAQKDKLHDAVESALYFQ